MFKNPFSFNGRIRRKEYVLSVAIFIAAAMISGALRSAGAAGIVVEILSYIILLAALWFLIAQSTKRCHDRSVSGLWQLIPFYGFVLLLAESDPGENKYGPNPKGIAYQDDWDPIARPNQDIIGEDGMIK
jgi:uncharacterized membrane protein YhaH (DUF805 family)